MNWNTDVQASSFDASATVSDTINARSGQRTASAGQAHVMSTNFWGKTTDSTGNDGSIIGMNVSKVGSVMVPAIEEYCNNIMNYVKGLEPAADSSNAFKSDEVQAALVNYFEKVEEYCSDLVSQLKAFEDKIVDAKDQWERATQEMASTIGSTSSSFASTTEYTAQKSA